MNKLTTFFSTSVFIKVPVLYLLVSEIVLDYDWNFNHKKIILGQKCH